jgi:integrase
LPKPYFLPRPSGLYVRFLIPQHAREAWGCRFLVRSLGRRRADEARLAAARLGYALAQSFSELRLVAKRKKEPGLVMVDHLHRPVRRRIEAPGDIPTSTAHPYQVEERSDGSWVVIANGAEDHAQAMETLRLLRTFPLQAPAPAPSVDLPASAAPSTMLRAHVELFLTQFGQKQRAEANKLDTTFTLRLFVGIVGDKPLRSIGTTDMDQWMDAIAHWPPNASKRERYRDLSPREVIVQAKLDRDSAISLRTREKHLDRLRVFMKWAVDRGELDRNPAAALHVMTRQQEDEQSRRAFTTAELNTIFHPAMRENACADTPARWWLPLLALHSGARAQELGQLHTQDVECVEGVWGIHIAARFPGQRLKNAQSKRFVPLHPLLIQAGLLDYRSELVEQLGDGPLFPGLGAKPGDAVGDWFNRTLLREHCHIETQVFHCFRHTFITAADRANLPESRVARLTGHSQGGSVLRGHYIDVPTLPERAAAVKALQFDLPQIARYHKNQFELFFQKHRKLTRRSAAVAKRAERKIAPKQI